MIGLNSILSTASQSLNAETGAIAVTNNNIANVNTPGYSRQIVNLSADALAGTVTSQGNGVTFAGFTSVRNDLLQIGINNATADSASLDAQSASWAQIESGFSDTSAGLGSAFSKLFSSISALSTSPHSGSLRQAAFAAANQVVTAFQQAAGTLTTAQKNANSSVPSTVTQVNQLSAQIAALDGQIASLPSSGQDNGSLVDQRNQLTVQLAQLVGISTTATGSTPTLTTGNGTPLVVGNQAYALQTGQEANGSTFVLDANGANITAGLTGGTLGGNLAMRDQGIPRLLNTLNQLATQFATAMNAAQAQGSDASGQAGQAMFTLPQGGTNAATGISLNLSSGSALALSSDGSTGSSGNVSNLLAVGTNTLPSGQTPGDSYANLVQTIGDGSSAASSSLTATSAALTQLKTQQASTSGVSVDEETTNLLRFQQAYQAAAQVISTINSMYSTLMNMTR